MRAALAQDWLADLSEFHESIVADACQEWRRGETKRPLIANLRALCVAYAAPKQTRPPHQVETSPHPFPSRDDYHWLKEREGQDHSAQDSDRIRAYQFAAKRLFGEDVSDPDLWPMIDAAERLMRQARAA